MITKELIGFSEFMPLTEAFKLVNKGIEGVYIVRFNPPREIGRLNGTSDILYIGSSLNLKRRFRNYLKPGKTQWTSRRINEFITKFPCEFSWKVCQNRKIEEHNLLRNYMADHIELPPLNRNDIKDLKLELFDKINISDKQEIS